MTDKEAMKLALEALERVNTVDDDCDILAPSLADAVVNAIDDIKEALAQTQEPVAWEVGVVNGVVTRRLASTVEQPQRPRVVFPTMLRKMWSGGEVQAWLDENVNKEKL